MRLASIHIYPVKSTRGSTLAEAVVEPWGLRHDRRWVVLRPDGQRLTARENSRLLTVTATPGTGDGLTLAAPSAGTLVVPRPPGTAATVPTTLSRLDGVRSCGSATDRWLAGVLGEPVRLGWLDDPHRRPVDPAHGGRPGDPLNLADAGPLLLTSTASLHQLQDWIAATRAELGEPEAAPLPMARFRPNVVVDGADTAFVEDGWKRLTIGEVGFRVTEPCDRCVLTMIDPDTRERGPEPVRTLARHRHWDGHVWFGVRLVPTGTGTIRTGDPVTVD